jgi:hypothetical protein
MARIRTVKPEFFRHEALYEAERASNLPLRLAFAGLWTAADREGRFKWQPRALKLDCLPYDETDFAAVLNALCDAGFIIKYQDENGGAEYGYIPGWNKHQHINQREAQSTLPAPTSANTCMHIPAHGEGKGREEEMEGKGRSTRASALPSADDWPSDFRERFWSRYPNKVGKPAALKKLEIARKSGRVTWITVMAGLEKYIAKTDDRPWCNPATWIHQDRWNDQPAQVQKAPMDAQKQRSDDALEQLRAFNRSRDERSRKASGVLPEDHGGRSPDFHNGAGRVDRELPRPAHCADRESGERPAGEVQVLPAHRGDQGSLRGVDGGDGARGGFEAPIFNVKTG